MIKKVAAIIIKNDCILSVSKKKAPDFYMLPGGKYEGLENDIEALSRELREELNVTISKMEFFGDYEDISMLENENLFLRTYITEIKGNPYPDNEIHNMKWIPIHS
ncbi:NUDIX hydrolase, partial [Staphylococcus pseudintermedius]